MMLREMGLQRLVRTPRYQCDCVVAGPWEPIDHPPLRWGRPGDEGPRTGTATRAGWNNSPLSCTWLIVGVLENSV